MSERIPKELKFGTLAFKVLHLGDGRLAFCYQGAAGKRVMVPRVSLEKLRLAAEEVARKILNAETAAQDLTADDRRMAASALAALRPTGLHLDTVAREVAEAWALTKGVSIAELGRFYASRNPRGATMPAARELVAQLLVTLERDVRPRSDKYRKGLKNDLQAFVAVHPRLEPVTQQAVRAYLRELKTRAGKGGEVRPVGPRRRDNVRDGIVRLFNFAKAEGYLPEDKQTEAEKVEKLKPEKDVTTWSPAEIQVMLEAVSWRWLPWLVLGAFAGLRTSEIFRLTWGAIKWERKVIAVQRKVARKVRTSRLVPMADNLIAFLAPFKDKVGPVFPHESWRTIEDSHGAEIESIVKKTGLKWKQNALRHSFGSHRLAVTSNYDQVAIEMGNSPAKVREDYNDPKDEAEGKAYFGIFPSDWKFGNVMPLEFEANG